MPQGIDMKQGASLSRQRGRGVIATIVLAFVLGGGLIGGLYWWSTRPAAMVSAPATAPPVATEQPAAAASAPVGEPAERAETAMQQKRMFVPPGENAFELYLQVADADPDNIQARNALIELFPYAVLFVEQRIAAGDATDGERVLALMRRADASAPALPRLDSALAELRTEQATLLAEAERRAAETAARAATPEAPATVAASTPPPPAATAPVQTPVPAPAETASAPPPVAAVAPPTAPSTTQSAPAAARPAAASGLPPVVSSVQPRYPAIATRRKIEGRVELQFSVSPDGRVGDVTVVSSDPPGVFDREAMAAMERWRFAPQAKGSSGRRVFDFKLN